ncbi:MAG: AAA family ATPase [Sulfitobacter sp.]
MIIKKLTVKDFRGIRNLKLSFSSNLTVIVGRNGAGKTTILDAIATMLQPIRMLFPNTQGKPQYRQPALTKEDIRFDADDCFLRLEYRLGETEISSPDVVEIRYSELGRQPSNPTLAKLWERAQNSSLELTERPLFVYYHQDRGFKNKTTSTDVFNYDILQETSLQADLKAINDLEVWWDKLDAQEARQVRDKEPKFRDPQLQAVRKLIRSIDSFSDISFSSTASQPGLFLTKKDGTLVHVDKLSSGERSYIILLADLARRLQVTAPNSPLNEIPGVVLIDEVELNLHPAWQSEILTTLRKTFANCQFIVTTHSPQVISAVKSEDVRILSASENGTMTAGLPLSTKGRTSNYLLEGIFGSSERYPPLDLLIDEFNDAIDAADLAAASQLFLKISNQIEGHPPDLIVLKKRLKKLEASK